jgi:hypothetical protein
MSENYTNLMSNGGTFYTSLADVSYNELINISLVAKSIHYWPPTNWSSDGLQKTTEELLKTLSGQYKLKIKNYSPTKDTTNSLSQPDQRINDQPQLWIVGCSFAYGFGLADKQRYIDIVSKNLNLPYSDLTSPGSSISWAADQILRADIRADDIVIWGLTGVNRTDYYIDNKYYPIVFNQPALLFSANGSRKEKNFFNKLITDDNQVNQSIKHLYQVDNFIGKIEAKLIILNNSKILSLAEHGKIIEEYLWDFDFVVDPANIIDHTDDGHPGPLTNQLWADQLTNFIISKNFSGVELTL